MSHPDWKDVLFTVSCIFFIWALISLIGSDVKHRRDNCGKVYPIDSVIHTNLFCEKVPKE